MAREDLNPIEEARACAALVEELGLTREEVGLRVGRSRVAVSNLLRLLDLPDETIELLEREKLSEGHGRALLLAEDHTTRRRLARDAVREGWSVRTVEARAREANQADGEAARASVERALTSPAFIPISRRPRPRSPRRSKRRWAPRSRCARRRAAIGPSFRLRVRRRRWRWWRGWERAAQAQRRDAVWRAVEDVRAVQTQRPARSADGR